MSTFNKPAGLSNIWAKDGAKITPPASKISEGWVVEIPPHQYMNHIENKQDSFIAHVNTHGIPKWDSATAYLAGESYVQGQTTGVVYKCVQNNSGQDPDQDSTNTYWEIAFAPLRSPSFVGEPRSTTPPLADRSTRIATTEYVKDAIDEISTNPLVRTPTNTSPVDNTVGVAVDVTLSCDDYYSLYGVPHQATEVRLATDKEMSGVVRSATLGAVTSWQVTPVLSGDSIYHWQMRYQDEEGVWSAWSTPTQVSTGAAKINPPVFINPTNGQTGVGKNPVYQLSPFTVSNGNDSHISTDWELRVGAPDGLRRWWAYNNTTNKLSIDAGVLFSGLTLEPNTDYFIRARFNGSTLGSSEWTTVQFKTLTNFYPTEIGEPYGGGYYAGRIWVGSTEYVLIASPKSGGEIEEFFSNTFSGYTPNGGKTLSNDYDNDWRNINAYSDGVANTQALRNVYNRGDTLAASIIFYLNQINNTGISGYKDWYIPSKDELNLLYRSFKPSTISNRTTGNTGFPFYHKYGYNANIRPTVSAQTYNSPSKTLVSVFQEGGSEAFTSALGPNPQRVGYYYWSSTLEINEFQTGYTPYIQSFRDGEQNNANMNIAPYDNLGHVRKLRVVRRERVVS